MPRKPRQLLRIGAATSRRFCLRAIAALAIAFAAWPAFAQALKAARYIEPVSRYGHFAVGRPHEYAAVTATTATGMTLTLRLPADEVFEDVAPRIVKLGTNAAEELLVVISNRKTGSRLALVGHHEGRLMISAQSEPIGTPMRWLNPVGTANLDDSADGNTQIAAVLTPHIGGILKVYRREGEKLVEIASLGGFSNHTYGSAEQGLSLAANLNGMPQLAVPDMSRRVLRLIALRDGRLVETSRCLLESPATGQLRQDAPGMLSLRTENGPLVIDVTSCSKNLR